jgi:hypothetical protein
MLYLYINITVNKYLCDKRVKIYRNSWKAHEKMFNIINY